MKKNNPQKEYDIAEALKLTDMPEEMRDDILDEAGAVLFRNMLMRSGDVLSKESLEELGELMDADAPFDELILFLEANTPDFEKLFTEESKVVRDALLAGAAA